MGKKATERFYVIAFVLISAISVTMLCGCPSKKSTDLPVIVIDGPPGGTVILPGADFVIKGRILIKDEPQISISYDGNTYKPVPVESEENTWMFMETLKSSNTQVMSGLMVSVTSVGGIQNNEKVVIISGTPGEVGKMLADQVRVSVKKDMLNQITSIGSDLVTLYKKDLIYGTTDPNSPFYSLKILPLFFPLLSWNGYGVEVIVDPKLSVNEGYNLRTNYTHVGPLCDAAINIGDLDIKLNPHAGNKITADVTINPINMEVLEATEDGKSTVKKTKNLAVYANIAVDIKRLAWVFVPIECGKVEFKNAEVGVTIGDDGKVSLTLDLRKSTTKIENKHLRLGMLSHKDNDDVVIWDATVLTGFLNWVMDQKIFTVDGTKTDVVSWAVKKFVLSSLNMALPDMFDLNILKFDIMDISAAIKPHLSTDELALGVSTDIILKPLEQFKKKVPALDAYYSTPNDTFPEITANGENLVMVINDDILNEGAYLAYQTGLINEIDLTSTIKPLIESQLSKLGLNILNKKFTAKIKVTAPPIIDFLTPPKLTEGGDGGGMEKVVAFNIQNVVVELKNVINDGDWYSLSVDAASTLLLKVSSAENGDPIVQGFIEPSTTRLAFTLLTVHTKLGIDKFIKNIPELVIPSILYTLAEKLVGDMVKFQVPVQDIIKKFNLPLNIKVEVISLRANNNHLVVKLKVEKVKA